MRKAVLDRDEIRRLYQTGLPLRTLARRFRTNDSRIIECLDGIRKPMGWHVKGKHKPQVAASEPILREMSAQGKSTYEIAEVLKLDPECVRRRMVRLGIPRLQRGAPGSRNVFWRGGRVIDKHGYVLIHAPDHPRASKGGYIREHRLVMEQHLGRPLLPEEVVHHDEDVPKSCNDPKFLTVYPDNATHLRETRSGKRPNWTPEGWERIQQAIRRPRLKHGSNHQASETDALPSP